MVQLRRGPGFVMEPGDLLAVQHGRERQHLQCHLPVERDLPSLVDNPHPAAGDLADDRVIAQSFFRFFGGLRRGIARGHCRQTQGGGRLVEEIQTAHAGPDQFGQIRVLGDQILGRRRTVAIQAG